MKKLDDEGKLKRNFTRPIVKDTLAVPLQGYAIVRFIADNPGFWMLHCHLDSHSDLGMMMIFKVGESVDLPTKPRNWPFYPTLSQESNRITLNIFVLFLFSFVVLICIF